MTSSPGSWGCLDHPPGDEAAHRVFNIGNHRAEYVRDLVGLLERHLGMQAKTVSLPKPEADPVETCADVSALHALCGYVPSHQAG